MTAKQILKDSSCKPKQQRIPISTHNTSKILNSFLKPKNEPSEMETGGPFLDKYLQTFESSLFQTNRIMHDMLLSLSKFQTSGLESFQLTGEQAHSLLLIFMRLRRMQEYISTMNTLVTEATTTLILTKMSKSQLGQSKSLDEQQESI